MFGLFLAGRSFSATSKRRLSFETRRDGASACTSSTFSDTLVFQSGEPLINAQYVKSASSPYHLDQSLDNTFILALDGDVEFNYIGVQRLVEVRKSVSLGYFIFVGDARASKNRWGLRPDAAKEVEEQFADFHANI